MSAPYFGPVPSPGNDAKQFPYFATTFTFGPDHDPTPDTGGGGAERPDYGQMLPRWNTGGRQEGA
jgi:hypothetical protein